MFVLFSLLSFLLFSACIHVSLKRSGGHIWRRTQQLPDEGEDLPQDGGHSPTLYITVVFQTSPRFKNIPSPMFGGLKEWEEFSPCEDLVQDFTCFFLSNHPKRHELKWFLDIILLFVSYFCTVKKTNAFCSLPTAGKHVWIILIIMTQLLHFQGQQIKLLLSCLSQRNISTMCLAKANP